VGRLRGAQHLQAGIDSLLQRGEIVGFQQLGCLAVHICQIVHQLVGVVGNLAIRFVFRQTSRSGEIMEANLLEQLLDAGEFCLPVGIVSKPIQKLVGRLILFQGISQVLSHHKTT
jgi:hypothetical protein